MNDSIVWLDGNQCRLDTESGTFKVDDPRLVARLRQWVNEVAGASEREDDGSFTATTMACMSEIARVRPYAGNARKSARDRSTKSFGNALPKQRVEELPQVSFAKVLESRRSVRRFKAPKDSQVHALLTHATRTRLVWKSEDHLWSSSRPYPSAGARHPIEVFVCARDVDGLEPGLYWFDPWQCRLSIIHDGRSEAINVSQRTKAALGSDIAPPAVICLVAELRRTLSRYSGGMSLVLRDAGALMATIGLVATAQGIATCPVGVGGSRSILRALDVRHPDWAEVGAIAVGRKASA